MSSLILIYLVFGVVSAQAPQDPIRDFCRRYGHQTAVIDRKLYIDGGYVYANPISQNPVPVIDTGLLYGDLDNLNSANFPTVHTNLSKNSSIPDVSGGFLWADEVNKIFWLYGGEFSSAPTPFQLWGYDVILDQWNQSSAGTDPSLAIQRVSYGAGITINDLGRGYYYGGYQNSLNTPLWTGSPFATSGLIMFDMDNNILTNKSGPSDGIGRAEGVMVSIPASALGMLVYFGGVSYPYKNSTEVPESLDHVMLYDIGDEKWYKQTTTGDIPASRRKFCGGVAWADDRSSYNVYFYGGFGFAENATGFDDVYILTMPSFQWIKWYPEPNATLNPHGMMSCNVISNSQMIIMGGNFTQNSGCDATSVLGMHNLNLGQDDATDAKWYQFLPNLTTYNVPPAIVSAIGGTSTGGATQVTPSSGWSDANLQVYFKAQAQYQPRTPKRSLPTSAHHSSSTLKSKTKIGAIVGGVVGGIILIVAVILLLFWYRRHRRGRGNNTPRPSPGPGVGRPSELYGNEKNSIVSHTDGPASYPQSPGASPPPVTPSYPYHPAYPHYDPGYQYYHSVHQPPSVQYAYHQPMYGYAYHPTTEGISPAANNLQHVPVQFSSAPEIPRQRTPAEMSAERNSRQIQHTDAATYVSSPDRHSQSRSGGIKRKGITSTSSPTETSGTHYSDIT